MSAPRLYWTQYCLAFCGRKADSPQMMTLLDFEEWLIAEGWFWDEDSRWRCPECVPIREELETEAPGARGVGG